MKLFDDCDILYPNLIIDILNYFSLENGKQNEKSVFNFINKNYSDNDSNHSPKVQPQIIDRICTILCNYQKMSPIKTGSLMGMQNNYGVAVHDKVIWQNDRKRLINYYNSLVYGLEYVYQHYKDKVVPIVRKEINGDESIGTGFKLFDGIATARHCLENAKSISIKGFTADELNRKPIYISNNQNLDLAFISISKQCNPDVYIEDAEIMQEVITMGYPKIPGFINFLTVEKATISSISEFCITPTTGEIAAIGLNIFSKLNLILITAKIKGGNSGSPVINRNGSIIGVACQIDDSEGDYDKLGYGIVTPISYMKDFVNKQEATLPVPKNYFEDFHEK